MPPIHIDSENFKTLVKLYQEPTRHYHDLGHVRDLLDRWHFYESILEPTPPNDYILEQAIWYHDAIYDSTSNYNEEQSAVLFMNHHPKMMPSDFIIRNMIMDTKGHYTTKFDSEYQATFRPLSDFFLSLDLLGFAEDASVCIANGKKIRQEYAHVSDEDWIGRSAFLEKFAARQPFFPHPFFEETMGDKARYNIDKEIKFWHETINH